MSSTKPFARIRAAAIDERLANVYTRQDQLQHLLKELTDHAQDIRDAIARDCGYSKAESATEYHVALSDLKEQYSSLNPVKALEEEYREARNEDAPARRQQHGVVYIVPTKHTPFYSVVAPLGAAIAAGNCVILHQQLNNTTRALPGLLKTVLRDALDSDVFDVATEKPDEAVLADCIEVLQEGSSMPPRITQLVSPASERVVAVVDRTADVQSAAKALVTARFSFNGGSPYAPDVILVNEFVRKPFLDAVVQQSIGFLTGKESTKSQKKDVDTLLGDADGIRVVTSGSGGTIVEVENRASPLLKQKIGQCCFTVLAVRSLDDAINFANNNGTLLASYAFSNIQSAKYLGQFIHARVAFANHVPTQLLVGPAAPVNYPVSPTMRYAISLFSIPRPHYVHPPPQSVHLSEIIRSADQREVEKLNAITIELPAAPKRPVGGGLGFFEEGLFYGLGAIALPLLAGLGTLGYFGVKAASARWWRS